MLIFFGIGIYGFWFLLVFFLYNEFSHLLRWWGWGLRLNEFITEIFDTVDVGLCFGEFLIHVCGGCDADNDTHDQKHFSIE